MTDFTRVTVVGATRRAVVVLPDDETVGALIPQVADLLEEPPGPVARPLALTRLTGEPLEPALTAAEQGLADGELLHLLRLDEAPPPPEVSDVTDAVSDAFPDRRGRWSDAARHTTAALAIGVLALAAGALADASPVAVLLLPAIWLVAVLAALVVGLLRRPAASRVLLAAALGVVLPATAVLAARAPVPVLLCVAVAAIWLTLLVGHGLATRDRGAGVGALIGMLAALLPAALLLAGLTRDEAAGVASLVGVAVLGLLPAYAMGASGLTGLDDQVLTGRLAPRGTVLRTLDRAYRALSWATVAVAVLLALALVGLAPSLNAWTLALGGLVVLVLALRTRAFPLTAQVVALWAALLIGVVAAVVAHASRAPLAAAGALVGVALVVGVLAAVRPAQHRRAALRRVGTAIEALAVIALLPVLLGVFAVYPALLGAFR